MSTLSQVGNAIDAKLKKLGITVTAGGEPTLICNDHEHAEWNTAALGPTKMDFGRRLAKELIPHLTPGCLVTHTMGKLYPGELIPRWLIGIHWREKGKPLANLSFFRLGEGAPQDSSAADKLAKALPAALGLKTRCLPAYENLSESIRQLEEKGKKPLTPYFSSVDGAFRIPEWSPSEQKEIKKLSKPVGWVLPLNGEKGAWISPEWPLPEPGDIVLWPGLSPIGLRLPLHLLAPEVNRWALTIEVRNGELGVFLPPVASLADYLEIVNAVRSCVTDLKLGPVVLEGYPPPNDGTLTRLNIIADPGVLEINLPPSADFAGYDRYVQSIYKAAKPAGLRSWKYQYTGRKLGTGGGAHILLGGPTAEESPFFLSPSLLPSIIRYFQHHPALSYLFTGLFVGPSSQAPRVDESEYEVPYELEIALRGVEKMHAPVNKMLLDLMLRNLLMDTLGNTHRAEISVDKLWNPYAPNGCLGLVEFRAFEMPPEPDMLMAAVALLRGLAAAFIEKPFSEPLRRWGADLHDRFSMPHFLRHDMMDVISFLNDRGFPFAIEHFEKWFAFRFPILGDLKHEGHSIEFRQAIEPWPVLGEQPAGGSTSRFVDSSTDRLQITVPDLDWAKKYLLLANGVPLQFFEDTEHDRKIAAVRYRMFYCVPGLQPHIAAQSPLLFELVDASTFRVVAAKSLRNWRPDQQVYDGLPQNDKQAAARVAERFTDAPATVCELRYIPKKTKPFESLYTTDLRFHAGS